MFPKPKPSKALFLLPNPIKTLKSSYVDVTMKWKKDRFFDSIDHLTKNKDLRPLLTIKNILLSEPDHSIPISAISKRGREFEISGRVAGFLRKYPSFFHEFVGPNYNHPHFKLTEELLNLHNLERRTYEKQKPQILDRLRRMILMSADKVLPFRVVQGLLWNLGLPEDFLKSPDECFETVDIDEGEKGLRVIVDEKERVLSAIERNASSKFMLFPSKGLRLKKKIENWMEMFQRLPYVSPYADSSGLDPCSDVAEKRVVGVLHEMLALFVDCSGERRRLLCLRKHLGLPQKFGKCFERHPHVFYLLLKNKTCSVVLKEAYCGKGSESGIEKHPMLEVRKKYVKLMNKSESILRSRRRDGKKVFATDEADDESMSMEGGTDVSGGATEESSRYC